MVALVVVILILLLFVSALRVLKIFVKVKYSTISKVFAKLKVGFKL